MPGLQKKLLFAFALILALQTCVFLGTYWLEVRGGHFGGDFICFWRAAVRLRQGALGAIYDPDGWARALAGRPKAITWLPYPPYVLALLWPLGALSYNTAVTWWSLAPLPFYAGLIALLVRRLDRKAWIGLTVV